MSLYGSLFDWGTLKIPHRKFSFFSRSHLSVEQITKIIYFWTYKYSQEIVVHESGLNCRTVVDFYNCHEVCSVILAEYSETIGGPGKVVEIDESKFGKRKYNRGKRVDGVWVFGGMERDSIPPKCFFVTVPDRSAATLIPIIKWFILPGTKILFDCWKAYSTLRDEGYLHDTVNHWIRQTTDSLSFWNSSAQTISHLCHLRPCPRHSSSRHHWQPGMQCIRLL